VKVVEKAATPATKKLAVKAQKAPRKKAAKALPKPVPLLPAGLVTFERRTPSGATGRPWPF
jgi:hypothetical protein